MAAEAGQWRAVLAGEVHAADPKEKAANTLVCRLCFVLIALQSMAYYYPALASCKLNEPG
jgi:hypothetical protein